MLPAMPFRLLPLLRRCRALPMLALWAWLALGLTAPAWSLDAPSGAADCCAGMADMVGMATGMGQPAAAISPTSQRHATLDPAHPHSPLPHPHGTAGDDCHCGHASALPAVALASRVTPWPGRTSLRWQSLPLARLIASPLLRPPRA